MRTKSVAIYVFASNCFQAFNQWVKPIALQAIALAPIIGAYIADKYGRKVAVAAASVMMLIGGIVGCFSTGTGMYVASRVILGFGTSWAVITGPTYVAEIAHPRLRARLQGTFYAFYYVGSITAAWLCFGMTKHASLNTWTWRLPNLLQGLGPVVLLVGIWFVPESPRWLASKGRLDEALAVLASEHANGKVDDELVLHELTEIKAAIQQETDGRGTGWKVYVQGSANRRRLLAVAILGMATQLSGNGIIAYYLAPALRQVGITDPTRITAINGGLSIFNFASALIGAFVADRFGRRTLFLFSGVGMLLMYSGMTAIAAEFAKTRNNSVGLAIVPFQYLFYFFYSIALTPLPTLYIPEIYSSALRVRATGIYSTIQSISLAFNVLVNPVALASITWRYYLVYVAAIAVFLVLEYFFLLETGGLTVEEAARVYDVAGDRKRAVAELNASVEAGTDSALHGSHDVDEKLSR